ncbi:hypothetical protein [Clostridium saccharobutylicum]|uniref:Uncharacterized protein n=1 Tax=Clostridium saccharobutylicum DSM 13864 TaxID=1345695 RepID=U5MTG3_CLOSA|nr:hypothetical protein [Clostridium saccharobutylicum]AGX44074.1 hypothetical protein CLSA_c31080 [Clostridium saccharobutylicum DSM 13864]AQR91365.1 hypothetical protein CLOSC_30900 [Clostridium saccharobutylicum]AQS01269.1 hypothetical protein CSACC_30970 [Clostridium saccharobutylicum]AQS15252.1 hypothetical protein CLOSACC_30970 [Clostridium saccharobutylicum]MBA2905873.1 hypothetical protein [Clostridium saccharobutylicum]
MVSKKIKKLICICSIISIIGGGFTNFTVANAATDNYATPYYENVQSSNSTSTQNNSDNGIPPEMPTNGQGGEMPSGGFSVDKGSEVKTTGVLLVDGTTETKNDQDIISSESNESTVKVTNSGSLTLSDSTLNKKSGDMTVEEASDFFGANSGFLADSGSTASIKDTEISTTVSGGNAVFATGEGTKINLQNVKINTTGDHSRGLDATYTGEIDADNVTINTAGAHCAAVATDRGEGTVTVKNSTLNTSGNGSPCIYSTGDINVSDTTGLSKGSSIAVIEGKNSIELNKCDLTGYAIGRGTGGVDDTGVMIYQSMSGDADNGNGTFSATDSKLTISSDSNKYETAPMFFVTNTNGVINLSNTELSFGSGVLLNVAGNDGEWSQKGSNGGNLKFNADNQTLDGDITVDNISTLELNLKSSTLKATVNNSNTAKELNISLDENSTWDVTGTSYVSSIADADSSLENIKDNGNTIYYDNTKGNNSWLNGQIITLSDGGVLAPSK